MMLLTKQSQVKLISPAGNFLNCITRSLFADAEEEWTLGVRTIKGDTDESTAASELINNQCDVDERCKESWGFWVVLWKYGQSIVVSVRLTNKEIHNKGLLIVLACTNRLKGIWIPCKQEKVTYMSQSRWETLQTRSYVPSTRNKWSEYFSSG